MPIVIPDPDHIPTPVLLIDTSGTAFGGTPTWTDYSSHLLLAGDDAKPISVTWGRQDEQSEPVPRQCSFLLNNTSGVWTPTNVAAPVHWDVGCRVRVSINVVGTSYDRFDGYVDSILPTWPGGVESWNVVEVSCTDITARLNIGQPLRSMVQQEMLPLDPLFLYPLSEASPSSSAGSIANATIPLTQVNSKYGPGTVAFGTQTQLADDPNGVAFASAYNGSFTPGAMSVLKANVPAGDPLMLPAVGGFSVECWFQMPQAPTTQSMMWGQFSSDGNVVAAWYLTSAQHLYFFVGDAPGSYMSTPSGTNVCDGRWHHAVAIVSSDYKTCRLVLDGIDLGIDTVTPATSMNLTRLTTMVVGGQITSNGASYNSFVGTLALVAAYPGQTSVASAITRYRMGAGIFTERSDERFARIAGYANLTTTSLPTGLATVGSQPTNGKSVTEALSTVARTEGTVSYVTGAGAVTFQARNVRYDPLDTLNLVSDDIDGGVAFRRDRQGFANEYTVTRAGGAAQRVVDSASQAQYGRFDGGSLDVVSSTDADALQLAAWFVALHKDPQTRTPAVTVNLLAQPDSTDVQNTLAAGMSTLLTVSNLPSQAPASSVSLFIEGGQEQIGPHEWSVTFNTSPALPFGTLRADASASARTKLDTGLKVPL